MGIGQIRGKKGWNTKLIKSAQAWAPLLEETAGDDFDYGDVRIGHIDTGYVEHTVFGSWSDTGLSEHILVDSGLNLIDPERDPRPTDPVDGGLNPGHGTRIGSVMYGFAPGDWVGVAPRAPVVPYRAVKSVALITPSDISRVADAIHHAVDNSFCSVINMSLGARPTINPWGAFRRAIRKLGNACDHAYEEGVMVVAALGNNVHDRATYPAKFWRSICAGGLEPEFDGDKLRDVEIWKPQDPALMTSDYQFVDTWAPADMIFRAKTQRRQPGTVQQHYSPQPDGDGSSYAAASVSGTAAIWLARRGAEIEQLYKDNPWMITEAFRSLLKATAQGAPSDAPQATDTGILDAKALVEAALPDPATLKYEDRESRDMWG